jgi:hypothetical protein
MMDKQVQKLESKNTDLSYRDEKKSAAKERYLDSIPTIKIDPQARKINKKILDSVPHFYHPCWYNCNEEFIGRPIIFGEGEYEFRGHAAPGDQKTIINTEIVWGNLDVVETTVGAKIMESVSVPVFILVPRKLIDNHDVKANADVSHCAYCTK